jgi:hypothetical protein
MSLTIPWPRSKYEERYTVGAKFGIDSVSNSDFRHAMLIGISRLSSHLARLPPELGLQVASYLPRNDIFKLVIVNRAISKAAMPILHDTLYRDVVCAYCAHHLPPAPQRKGRLDLFLRTLIHNPDLGRKVQSFSLFVEEIPEVDDVVVGDPPELSEVELQLLQQRIEDLHLESGLNWDHGWVFYEEGTVRLMAGIRRNHQGVLAAIILSYLENLKALAISKEILDQNKYVCSGAQSSPCFLFESHW